MDNCQKLQIDEAERRFQLDLEKAKALSLETAALDRFKQEKLKESAVVAHPSREPSPIYATVRAKSVSSSPFPLPESSTSPKIQIKPRPRPGGINSQSVGLVPPPVPKRQLSQSPNSNDLINLMSPIRARPSDLEDSFLFEELDLAFPNMNLSSNRSSRHAVLFPNHLSVQNVPQHLSQPIPTSSLPSPVVLSKPKLNSSKKGPISFDESMFNRNLIDLAVESTHPRYSILRAFDPLLSPNPVPEQAVTPVACSSTSTEKNKTDEFLFDQDYDPFDYFLGLSQRAFVGSSTVPASSIPETIYEVITKEQSPAKPATSSNKRQSIVPPAQKSKDTSLKVVVNEVDSGAGDLGLVTFVNLVRQVRSRFRYDEAETNTGYVVRIYLYNNYTLYLS
jgi:phosphatidylinositol-4-phosphate 3-kinase